MEGDFESDDEDMNEFENSDDDQSAGDVPDLPDSFDQTSVMIDLPWETANQINQTRFKRRAEWNEDEDDDEEQYFDDDEYEQYSEYDEGYER